MGNNPGTYTLYMAAQSATWDGVDRQGRNLPSGVYLARISTPKGAASRKIVLAR